MLYGYADSVTVISAKYVFADLNSNSSSGVAFPLTQILLRKALIPIFSLINSRVRYIKLIRLVFQKV